MKLHDADTANQFETRKECQDWINERIVRFKLRMVRAQTQTPGEFTFVPQKCEGQIMNSTVEDFQSSGTDEPLKHYAEPVKDGDVWMAVMKVR